MNTSRQRGTTLGVGLILLSLVTLLGLAGASTAHIERLLAQNALFRENAASAASAGIEFAISRIVTTTDPAAATSTVTGAMPDTSDHYEIVTRFAGYDAALPQAAGAHLAGAHFEIVSTGFSSRHALDRQRAEVLLVLDMTSAAALDCEPVVPVRCLTRGQLLRLSWQHAPAE